MGVDMDKEMDSFFVEPGGVVDTVETLLETGRIGAYNSRIMNYASLEEKCVQKQK